MDQTQQAQQAAYLYGRVQHVTGPVPHAKHQGLLPVPVLHILLQPHDAHRWPYLHAIQWHLPIYLLL